MTAERLVTWMLLVNLSLACALLVSGLVVVWHRRRRAPLAARDERRLALTVLLLALLLPVLAPVLPPLAPPAWLLRPTGPSAVVLDAALLVVPFEGPHEVGPLQRPRHDTASWPDIVLAAWLAGAALFAVRLVISLVALRKVCANSALLRSAGSVRVLASSEASVPFAAAGGTRSLLVVPTSLLERAGDLRLVLRHEAQHVRGGDPRWALAMEVLRVVCWWNPAVHAWCRRLASVQEAACDEVLVSSGRVAARDYVDCLLRVAEEALASRQRLAGVTAMARPGGPCRARFTELERRVNRIMSPQPAPCTSARLVHLTAVVTVLLLAVAWGSSGLVARAPAIDTVAGDPARRLAELRELLVAPQSDSSLVMEIESGARSAGLDLTSMTPRRRELATCLESWPIDVEVSGSWSALTTFARRLAGAHSLLRPATASLAREGPDRYVMRLRVERPVALPACGPDGDAALLAALEAAASRGHVLADVLATLRSEDGAGARVVTADVSDSRLALGVACVVIDPAGAAGNAAAPRAESSQVSFEHWLGRLTACRLEAAEVAATPLGREGSGCPRESWQAHLQASLVPLLAP